MLNPHTLLRSVAAKPFSQAARRLDRLAPAATAAASAAAEAAPKAAPAPATPGSDLYKVSTLPNGVRVATDATPGHFVACGVYVNAGSRFESSETLGASHVLSRLAFKSTASRSEDEIETAIASIGGSQRFLAAAGRDHILYQTSTLIQHVPLVLSIFSDSLRTPQITPEELAIQREAIAWENSEIEDKPEMILPEILHAVAFGDRTLGRSVLCSSERLETITPAQLRTYLHTWYRPDRLVVAGAGIAHARLVELAAEYFGDMKPAVVPAPADPRDSYEHLSTETPAYLGGELYLDAPASPLTHVYVAWESLSILDDDIWALATLQMLLGGGSSFSAGGPGKGMYSRLYTTILNRYGAVDQCGAFHQCYNDAGLFGMFIAVEPSFAVPNAAYLIANSLDSITKPVWGGIDHSDLQRAKNQLKSSLSMALESRLAQVEDLGRQVMSHGYKLPIVDMAAKIDALRLDDIYRVANRVLRPYASKNPADKNKLGRPSIVVQGPLQGGRAVPDVLSALRAVGLAGRV